MKVMTKDTEYQIRRAEARVEYLSEINLLSELIIHGGRQLNVAVFPAIGYGGATPDANVASMLRHYFHSSNLPNITFTPATTAESVSAAAYRFCDFAKPKIFDHRCLQAGRVFKADEWVVFNPPKDEQGELITDERIFKGYLDKAKKVNGIYIIPNGKIEGVRDCSFVPYDSFKQEVQSAGDFVRSGLARGLEHTLELVAPKLEMMINKTNYPGGVHVFGFKPEEIVKVVSLGSDRLHGVCKIFVGSYYWYDCHNGYAFGVRE